MGEEEYLCLAMGSNPAVKCFEDSKTVCLGGCSRKLEVCSLLGSNPGCFSESNPARSQIEEPAVSHFSKMVLILDGNSEQFAHT